MKNKAKLMIIIAMVAVIGLSITACGGGGDPALNGTWIVEGEDGSVKTTFNRGTFEITGLIKGTYTAQDGSITITTTNFHGDMFEKFFGGLEQKFESKWHSRSDLKTALKAVDAEVSDADIEKVLDNAFVTQTGTYSVNGTTLTIAIGDETTTYTKK